LRGNPERGILELETMKGAVKTKWKEGQAGVGCRSENYGASRILKEKERRTGKRWRNCSETVPDERGTKMAGDYTLKT